MTRLLMVRHGDTKSNSAERYWGQTDVELNAAGIRQAERLRNRLVSERINAVYASNLCRASATAEIIASGHHLEITNCPELGEVNFGCAEGMTFAEISRSYPALAKSWVERDPALQYPEGENLPDFDRRVSRFLSKLKEHAPEETVLIVSHSGVLRTLICILMGVERQFRWQLRIDLGSLSIVETYPQQAILGLLNDVSHLS